MTLDNLVIIAKGYCDLYYRDLVVSNFLKYRGLSIDDENNPLVRAAEKLLNNYSPILIDALLEHTEVKVNKEEPPLSEEEISKIISSI